MPFKRSTQKRAVSKKQRKSRKPMRKRKTYLAPTNYIGFPRNKIVKLRYVHTQSFSAAATVSTFYFSANGCFDPDITGGGHQPLGFDQWSTFYNHYVVKGSRITLNISGGNLANNSDAGLFFCYLTDDTSTTASAADILEQGKAHYRMIPGNIQTQRPLKITNTFSTKKFFDIKDVKDNITRVGAPISANPTEQAYYACGAVPISGASTFGGNWQVVAVIEYIVEFDEPKQLSTS